MSPPPPEPGTCFVVTKVSPYSSLRNRPIIGQCFLAGVLRGRFPLIDWEHEFPGYSPVCFDTSGEIANGPYAVQWRPATPDEEAVFRLRVP